MATIFALSSGQGKVGVAVIRISGRGTAAALQLLVGRLPEPRTARLKAVRHPLTGDVLDRGLVLWFPGPGSFTGEDMAELQVHGGRAVLAGVFAALTAIDGLRPAEPGEFARRAFENGKLDLTEAEALADLIDAETDAQRRQALRQSGGALRAVYEQWRTRLIELLAAIEAELDFSDEGDVPEAVALASRAGTERLRAELAAHLADGRRGEILREGLRVVIAGPPNAGKSSLMNALARRDVVIVSAEAGTTRDVIEVRLDLGGYPVILVDTAGIREAAGEIEGEGVRRALREAREADLVLWLSVATDAASDCAPPAKIAPVTAAQGRVLRVANKVDLLRAAEAPPASAVLSLSVRTGAGMSELLERLTTEAKAIVGASESPAITRARHRHELERCQDALDRFLSGDFRALELRAEDLRQAATALGRLTGRVDVEDVLDKIFADFCIGK